MEESEMFDLVSRVESLYWNIYQPYIQALDKRFGPDQEFSPEPEFGQYLDLPEIKNTRGSLDENKKERIARLLAFRNEQAKEKINEIYEQQGVNPENDPWYQGALMMASFNLAEDIKKNSGGNLVALMLIRWGLRSGVSIIPDESYRPAVYKVIEELEGEDGEKIKKMTEAYNHKE